MLSGGGYHDVDNGDTIEYSGTTSKDSTPTEHTAHLIRSCELGNNVRVIRSAQLSKKNPFRPECGLRYDGLYKVVSYVLTNEDYAMYRFRLERRPGQHPIRCQNNSARRPTRFEVEEFLKLKAKIW